jgi:hypothetical protein
MGYSVGSLNDYVKENIDLLLTSSVLGAKTQQMIQAAGNVLADVKYKETLNLMESDAIFQANSACGWNASGNTSITQRVLEVAPIKVQEALCPKDLEKKYTQQALTRGSHYDTTAFAQEFTARKAERIASQLERAMWQGDTTSVDVNLNKFDGFLEIIKDAGASVVNANSIALHGVVETDITNANVVSIFDDIYKAIPAEIVDKDDVKIFCGMDVFRTLTVKIKNDDLFHYQVVAAPNTSFFLPGTSIEVVGVPGLNGTKKIVACRMSNLWFGTDLLDEGENRWRLFYAMESDQVRFSSEFKAGVQIAFPTEIVKFFV